MPGPVGGTTAIPTTGSTSSRVQAKVEGRGSLVARDVGDGVEAAGGGAAQTSEVGHGELLTSLQSLCTCHTYEEE